MAKIAESAGRLKPVRCFVMHSNVTMRRLRAHEHKCPCEHENAAHTYDFLGHSVDSSLTGKSSVKSAVLYFW